jgi:hypothetical protein
MRKTWFAIVLLSGGFLVAQDYPGNTSKHESKDSKGQVTVQGHDLRTAGYPQDKAAQLPRTARRGNGERIGHDELQLRCPE